MRERISSWNWGEGFETFRQWSLILEIVSQRGFHSARIDRIKSLNIIREVRSNGVQMRRREISTSCIRRAPPIARQGTPRFCD